MPKKKKNATPVDHPPCGIRGCNEPGEHKAPKSRAALRDYEWLCLEHVRERNRTWDYFEGMDRDAIEAFMRDAVTGHRPTWSRESASIRYWEELHEALGEFLHTGVHKKQENSSVPFLSANLRAALAEFDMDYPYTHAALKLRYRALVKKYHPDANKGARQAEEKFKQIAAAYLLLAEHIR